MTDVEGNWEYFNVLVERSPVVSWAEGGTRLQLAAGGYFVHGGDSPDKGPGDIRVVSAMVQLKMKHPDRVFLILGNRDINKLRFGSELAAGADTSKVDVFWDAKHMPYTAWLEEHKAEAGTMSALKWMLDKTMGCQTTFATRRAELGVLRGQAAGDVSDGDVLESFKQSVDPGSANPWMLRYIQLGQLMLVLGDIVFVHGAISESALGFVPGKPARCPDLLSWCTELNAWCSSEVRHYARSHGDPALGTSKRAADDLLTYGVPVPPGHEYFGKTVIYNDGFVKKGDYVIPDTATQDFLVAAGVHRACVGHIPRYGLYFPVCLFVSVCLCVSRISINACCLHAQIRKSTR